MSIHIIPVDRLSVETLRAVIEEFISREATDYGAMEVSPETKFRQVRQRLETGLAVLIFDDETETTNMLLADNPILRGIKT
ncbi:MAG TPA: YheU family protein [Syntrophorhabdales bacterium]|nr:YheU family protein [Syntrophorhabdales bacterium]